MAARRGDLVVVYDARDLGGSSTSLGMGVFLSKEPKPGDLFDDVSVLMDDKTLSGPYTVVVLQRRAI